MTSCSMKEMQGSNYSATRGTQYTTYFIQFVLYTSPYLVKLSHPDEHEEVPPHLPDRQLRGRVKAQHLGVGQSGTVTVEMIKSTLAATVAAKVLLILSANKRICCCFKEFPTFTKTT